VARVRDKITQLAAKRSLPVDHIRCNVGVAYSQSPPETPDELLREADQVMHRAKS
jgi:GGDEF domain-containing protein